MTKQRRGLTDKSMAIAQTEQRGRKEVKKKVVGAETSRSSLNDQTHMSLESQDRNESRVMENIMAKNLPPS